MAAYAALVSLFNDLELIPNHTIHSFSFDDKQISSLSQIVEILIDFMDNYDSHGCTSEAVDVLETGIASAAHAAHDVIESHLVDQIHAGYTRDGKVRSYFLLDLQKAIHSMEFVKRKAMQFKAQSGSKAEQPAYSSTTAASSQPLKSNVMVGFDEFVVRLVDILTGEPSNQRVVIPITGMGGLGKTSLAKTTYEHSYVKHHFDVHLWATISQQYTAEHILTQLLYGERNSTVGGDVSELGEHLHKRLWCRRYLIVLDDMWSLEAWNGVYRFLPDICNGSRVVVTTRLSNLAARLSSSPFKLSFLDEDKSWQLFCGKAFGEEDCPIELEEIGKKIVKRCGGLPLSIVVMGGHLRKSSRSIEYWEKVANYMYPLSSLGEEEQCLEILSLSYQHLPACLKPCFLYPVIFRKDLVIEASKLIQFWIGEGFIKAKRGLSLEEVGEDYLKDLIDRNLILVHRRRWNGKVEYCKLHDSVREVCLKVCKKDKFLCEIHVTARTTSCRDRRLVIQEREKLNSDMIGAKQLAPILRTLVYRGGNSLLNELLVDCSLLRVLVHDNDVKMGSKYVPLADFLQVNLRTLSFGFGLHIEDLAYSILSSISAWWNLQTLRMIVYSKEPITLPYEIWEMSQLKHLIFVPAYLPNPVLNGGTEQEECIVLQNLHTLEGVVDLRLTEEVCRRMPNLKSLKVIYNHFGDDYCFQNLVCFNKLESVEIKLHDDPRWCDVILSLKFPTSLEWLFLDNCHLGWEDLTIMISSQLPHLRYLQLHQVRGSEWSLDEEEFCCLKRLDIRYCEDLIHWNANNTHFPVLESLELFTPKLSEIPLDIGEIPTLRSVEMEFSNAPAAVSAVRMLMEQETYGNHDIQLCISFWSAQREEFERFQEVLQQECLATNNLFLYYGGKKIKTY